jgi:hypothetical protein
MGRYGSYQAEMDSGFALGRAGMTDCPSAYFRREIGTYSRSVGPV